MLIVSKLFFILWMVNIGAQGFSMKSAIDDIGKTIQRRLDDLQVEGLRDLDRLEEMIGSIGRQFQPATDRMGRVAESFKFSDLSGMYDPLAARQDISVSDAEPGLLGTLNRLVGNLEKMNPVQGIINLFNGNWWEAENVCTETRQFKEMVSTEEDGRQFHYTIQISNPISGNIYKKEESCEEVWPVRQCKKQETEDGETLVEVTTWSCCHGAQRSRQNGGKCVKVPTQTVEETARELGALEFLALLEDEHLLSRLKGPVTLFLPTDEAVQDFEDVEARLNGIEDDLGYRVNEDSFSYRRKKRNTEGLVVVETADHTFDMRNILLAHFMTGVVRSDQLYDGQILGTGKDLKDESVSGSVRITVYNSASGERVVMANCARLITPNTMASDGIVHLVDRMIVPAMDTIANILEADSQFRTFVKAAKKDKELWRKLSSSSNQQFTVFAPTEAAFDKLSSNLRNRIINGDLCGEDILRGHVIPNLLCSSIVEGNSKTRNMLGDYVRLSKDANELTINGQRLVLSDMTATNGVVHVIEDLLLPSSAESDDSFLEAIHEESPFMANVIEAADMAKELQMMSDITLLLPSLDAVSQLPVNYTVELIEDKERLREFLSYHILAERSDFEGISSEEMFETKLSEKKVRVNRYSSILSTATRTAQCAKIHPASAQICGGSVFSVDQILLPPQGSLLDLLKMMPEFSRFLEVVMAAEMEDDLEVESRTLLAPVNSAFDSIDEKEFLELLNNKNKSMEIVSRHILDSVECCAGIQLKNTILGTDQVDSLNGAVSIRKTSGGHLAARDAQIFKCDVTADNGVLHYVDKVFKDKLKKSTSALSSILDIFKQL